MPGVDPATHPAAVSVDLSLSQQPRANGVAMVGNACSDGGFAVITTRIPAGGGAPVSADDVGFTILIP